MTIEIENLTFNAIIGILNSERKKEQKVIITLKAKYNYNNNYIDYVQICNIIKKNIKESKFKLLEEAIASTSKIILEKFNNIEYLYIKISKPDILKDCIVSISKEFTK